MKNNLGSSLLLLLVLGAIGVSIAEHPPGGVRWAIFAEEPATFLQKCSALAALYVWPGVLSCFAISMFQLQARISSTGANKRVVFSMCAIASATMLVSLRSMALSSTSGTSYVAGMALGYTMMSRLYAVRMRLLFGRVRVPWPVWRGDARGVQEINSMAAVRMGSAQASR
jgi:hypothetical protein